MTPPAPVVHPTHPGDVVRAVGGDRIGLVTEVNSPRGRLAGKCGVMWVGGSWVVGAWLNELELIPADTLSTTHPRSVPTTENTK